MNLTQKEALRQLQSYCRANGFSLNPSSLPKHTYAIILADGDNGEITTRYPNNRITREISINRGQPHKTEKKMNIITDRTKAPAKLHYRVSNNSGSINKEFGKNQQAAYDFANGMKETATIRGYFVFKYRGEWQTNTVFIDHVFK